MEAEVVRGMIAHARSQSPLESCGLLTRRGAVIDGLRRCTNELASRTRFSIPPAELFRFFRGLEDRPEQFAGIYHSHPTTPAEPSRTDVANFHYPGVTYWIVSLADDEPSLGCYDWTGDGFEPLRFQVEGERP